MLHRQSLLGCTLMLLFRMSLGSVMTVDMTHKFNNDTLYWPSGQYNFELDVLHKGLVSSGKYWYEANQFRAGEHGGTHLDAPCHFARDRWTADQIPPERFIAAAVVIDIRNRARTNADAQVLVEDLDKWEKAYGQIPANSVVLQCSGWDSHWPNKTAVFGNGEENVTDFHFPALHVDAARRLVLRGVYGVGVDTPSVDYGVQLHTFPVHEVLAEANVYGLENVKATCAIPVQGATLYVFPMFVEGGSGGPARIMARWDTAASGTSRRGGAAGLTWGTAVILMYMCL